MRTLLRCLVMKPELARELPKDWQGEGAEGAAIHALVDWLNESADETSTAAMIQHFQGSTYEATFASAQADVMQWGEDFDVGAEFADTLQKVRRDVMDAELETLNAKMRGGAGGLSSLNKDEQARYLQLLQLGKK